jgi:hypothetical protein
MVAVKSRKTNPWERRSSEKAFHFLLNGLYKRETMDDGGCVFLADIAFPNAMRYSL